MVDLGPRASGEETDFQAAKNRINSKLELLRTELKAMHEQDVTLLRTLMNIHFTISALGGRAPGGLGRSDSNSSLYTVSGAATPVSGTQSPMLPFKRLGGGSLAAPAFPLQRMLSAPSSRAGSFKYGSMHSSASSSLCGDEDDEPLGWSYNSTASDCGPLAWSLDIEHLETHLSSVLSPVPEAFRRLRNHPENQSTSEPEPMTQSSSLAIMVRKPDQKPEFRVEHVTADEYGSLVLPVNATRGSTGHSDFLSFVVDNTIINDTDDDLDDVLESDEVESGTLKKKQNVVKETEEVVEPVKPLVMETSTVSFTINGHEDTTSPLQSPTSPISAVALHFPHSGTWPMASQTRVVNGHAVAYNADNEQEMKYERPERPHRLEQPERPETPKAKQASPEPDDIDISPIVHVKDVVKKWQQKVSLSKEKSESVKETPKLKSPLSKDKPIDIAAAGQDKVASKPAWTPQKDKALDRVAASGQDKVFNKPTWKAAIDRPLDSAVTSGQDNVANIPAWKAPKDKPLDSAVTSVQDKIANTPTWKPQNDKPATVANWKAPRPFVRPLNLEPETDVREETHKQYMDKHVNEPFPNELTLAPSPPPQPTHKRSFSGNVGRLLNMFQTSDSPATTSTSPLRKRLASTDRSCSIQDLCSASSTKPKETPGLQELKNRLGGQLSASISNLASGASLHATSPPKDSDLALKSPPSIKPKPLVTQSSDSNLRPFYTSHTVGDNPIARKNRSMMLVNAEPANMTSQIEIPFTPTTMPSTLSSTLPRQGTPFRVSVTTPSRVQHFEIPMKTHTPSSNAASPNSTLTKTSVMERRIGTPPREITFNPITVKRDMRGVPLTRMLADSPKKSEISVDMNQNQKDCGNGQAIQIDGNKTSSIQLFI